MFDFGGHFCDEKGVFHNHNPFFGCRDSKVFTYHEKEFPFINLLVSQTASLLLWKICLGRAIRAHGSDELPEGLNQMTMRYAEFKVKYKHLLDLICDELPVLVQDSSA